MFTKKLTKAIILIACILAIGSFASHSQAQSSGSAYTTLWSLGESSSYGGTSTGWAIQTVSNQQRSLVVDKISIFDANTTTNTITVYDAKSYADATANNRAILAEYVLTNSTTALVRYGGIVPGVVGNASVLVYAGMRGVIYLGDPGAEWDYRDRMGRGLQLNYGLVFKSTNGAFPFDARIVMHR